MKPPPRTAICPHCKREVELWNYRDLRNKLRWHMERDRAVACRMSNRTIQPPVKAERSEP